MARPTEQVAGLRGAGLLFGPVSVVSAGTGVTTRQGFLRWRGASDTAAAHPADVRWVPHKGVVEGEVDMICRSVVWVCRGWGRVVGLA